jgi:hypothetical protein
MKKLFGIALVLSLFGLGFSANALGANPSEKRPKLTLPEKAIEVAPGVFSLGTAVEHGKQVEGYAFVDYRRNWGKPGGCNYDGKCQGWEDASCADCSGNNGATTGSSCYGFLAKGAKWNDPEPYVINPSNLSGLDESFVVDNLAADISKWEDVAGADILGSGTSTQGGLTADLNSPDGKNEVYFGDIDSPNAIGVTIVWGIFTGPPSQRELVEWDQVYDDHDFAWSSSGEVGKMDFENIATHELGHSVGLDDLYESICSEQTMYGYAAYGETKKRTLESGDITGISLLY